MILIVKNVIMKVSNILNPICSARTNRVAYGTLVLAGVVFLVLRDCPNAIIMLGMSLIAEPFDSTVKFSERPLWQRLWLSVHLATLYTVIVYEIIIKA